MSQVLTLASFQSIASSSVPLGCILAYNNTRLSGCKRSDFRSGTGCSASCQRSIQSVEATLQLVCGGGDDNVPSGSVLASAMEGNLVNTLCGNGLQQPTTTVVTTTTTVPRESNSAILSTVVPPASTTASAAPTTTATTPTPALPPPPPPPRPDTESPSATSTPDPDPAPAPAPPSPGRGGGSPFDAQGSAGTSSPTIPRLSLVMSWTFVLLLLIR
ncbi:hypothetical protein PspLS_02046 [Pyricularia sp. CBS 133598]|nr:hypothetical protein PspLS_02046 [Pyricularia sp. CBS 133598]